MLAVVVEPTAVVLTANVALQFPAGTLTLAGTVAAGLSLFKAIAMPLLGAGALKVTVPVDEFPPVTTFGFSDTADTVATVDMMLSGAVTLAPLYLAVMVAVVEVVTAVVVTTKVAVEYPAATLTVAGTVAEGLLLLKTTDAPPLGAGLLKITAPVEGLPPGTLVGFSDTADSTAAGVLGVILSGAVTFAPL